jgi:ComF family protein
MRPFLERLLQFFLPSQCYCCQKFLDEGQQGLCSSCFSGIRWIEPPFCSVCGIPFVSAEIESHCCGHCLTKRKYFTMGRALGYYEGSLREAIHRWKYQGKTYLTSLFGEWMAGTMSRYWDPSSIELLIPVPLHPRRLRERGFNQALLLARELSRRTGIPFRKRLLRKERSTLPQVSLSGRERERGVKGVFNLAKEEEVGGKSILLIDDVYTTGATVNECAKMLLARGAKRVDVFTVAHAVPRE